MAYHGVPTVDLLKYHADYGMSKNLLAKGFNGVLQEGQTTHTDDELQDAVKFRKKGS